MKKSNRIARLLVALILAIFFVVGICACSTPVYDEEIDNRYAVNSVRTQIEIDKNGTAQITEVIEVGFKADGRRGIIRDLPTHAGESYKDITAKQEYLEWGSKSKSLGRTQNIPNNYFVTTESGFICINTGTKDTEPDYFFYTGDKVRYTFNYTIVPPAKYAKAENYYINVLGQGWSAAQSDISITIKFPSSVQKAILYYGKQGSDASVDYTAGSGEFVLNSGDESKVKAVLVSEDTLEITSAHMDAYNGITLQCAISGKLGRPFDFRILAAILAAIIFVAAVILIKILNPQKPVVEVVNFYPPKEKNDAKGDGLPLNPAEVGILIDGQCSPADITSMIFYWAGRGHLQIQGSDDEKSEKKGKDLTLVKLVELPAAAPAYEKQLFAALFKTGNRVLVKSLENKFYMHIQIAQHAVTTRYRGKLHKMGVSIAAAVVSALIPIIGYFVYGFTLHPGLWVLQGVMCAIPVAGIYILGFLRVQKIHKYTDKQKKSSFVGIALLSCLFALLTGFINRGSLPFLFVVPLNIAACAGAFFAPLFIIKTDFYRSKLGDIIGFKNFLATAEKSRLEMLLEENPQYYYDILPYANVLGVSDIWEKKFEGLALQPPTYYYSPYRTAFNFIIFNSLYRSMFNSFRSAAVSRPSSSGKSGGGFGGGFGGGGFGGGFSGGGFGGGGGRSR